MTLSDMNQMEYARFKAKGLSDEDIEKVIGSRRWKQMEKDKDLSFYESHFGMKEKWFYIMLAVVIVGALVFGLIIGR